MRNKSSFCQAKNKEKNYKRDIKNSKKKKIKDENYLLIYYIFNIQKF